MNELHTHLIATTIGAAIGVISVASFFIYQKILEKKHPMKNTTTKSNFDEINRRLIELQEELETLREQQNQQRKKKKLNRKHISNDSTYSTTDNDTDIDCFLTADTDNDEFFDCSDSENGASDIETRTTEATCSELNLSILDKHSQQEGFEADVYHKLQNLTDAYPNDVNVVWRYARSCYKYSNCINDLDVRKTIILEGINTCEKLLTLSNADLHKWYAILIGVHGQSLPTAEKIKNGYRYKEHVMKALEIRPNDADLHHLLGRFKYEVANLSWIERKVAATLYSEPPSASYEDAIDSFQEAEITSNKVNLENQLFLSKCYIALSKYDEAVYWLKKICDLSIENEDDRKIQNDAHQLLKKYSEYTS